MLYDTVICTVNTVLKESGGGIDRFLTYPTGCTSTLIGKKVFNVKSIEPVDLPFLPTFLTGALSSARREVLRCRRSQNTNKTEMEKRRRREVFSRLYLYAFVFTRVFLKWHPRV